MAIRAAVGVLVCLVYPLLSWIVPSVGPAWGMYTSTTVVRLQIVAVDRAGVPHVVPASALASHASPRTGATLLGAERWKHVFPYHLGAQVGRLAELVCTDARVSRAEVTFEMRDDGSRGARTMRAARRCERAR